MAVKWRVDELARRKGWNAQQLAARARVDIKTARNILNGKATRVDLETIGRIADALGVEPGPLWRQTPSRRKNRWTASAGIAGIAPREEMERILGGRDWDIDTDPGLERATRES